MCVRVKVNLYEILTMCLMDRQKKCPTRRQNEYASNVQLRIGYSVRARSVTQGAVDGAPHAARFNGLFCRRHHTSMIEAQ